MLVSTAISPPNQKTRKVTKWTRNFFFSIFMTLGLLFVVIGIYTSNHSRIFKSHSLTATAIVKGYKTSKCKSEDDTFYECYSRILSFKDISGIDHQVIEQALKSKSSKVGVEIEITYLKSNPKEIMTKSAKGNRAFPYILSVIGLLVFFGAYWANKKKVVVDVGDDD